ncbi:EAL domain-containing protein [Pseudoduganella sp. GCM10020061]|uniref:EAL domain-containing protein n=1 Tax=Pseudoduganella sp. GCM10020061 TaxID=3317345 RepID=UPI00363712EC
MIQRIFLLALLSVCALAQAAPARLVRVGIYANAPKVYINANGAADGILVDMLREVARGEQWTLQFVECNWAQCLAALEQGSIDLLPDVAWTEERSRLLDFHEVPALISWSQVYRRSGVAISSLADLGGKRVAVLAGSIQQRFLADLHGHGGPARLVPVKTIADGFDMAERGEVDAVVTSYFVGRHLGAGRSVVETPIMFQPARLFYAVGKGRNRDLLGALDLTLANWQRDPDSAYFEILERWRTRDRIAQVPGWLWWAGGVILALLLGSVVLVVALRLRIARKIVALWETEHRLGTVLDSVDSLIYMKDRHHRYTYANRSLRTFLGRDEAGIIGRQDSDLFSEPVAAQILGDDVRTMAERQRLVTEETVPDAHGRPLTFVTTKIPLCREDGSVYGLCGISTDISERRAAEEANRIAATVFQSAEGMFVAGPDRRLLRVNDAYASMTGFGAGELAGAPLPAFSLERDGEDAGAAMWASAEAGGKWQGEIWTRRKNGRAYPARLTVTAVRDAGGRITHFVGTQGDITAQTLAQDEIAKLAYYDSLTGLPNRRRLLERLRHCLPLHRSRGQVLALLILDLDNFKDLNDLRGHENGDRLLQQVGERISACTRPGDTVARLGGDEFVVVLENAGMDEQEAASHAAATGWNIIAAVREPFLINGMPHFATCSVGAALATPDDGDIDSLMKRGDMAMYGAKRNGRNTLQFFHPDMEAAVTWRLALEGELRDALERSTFALHYQPQVDGQGRITGAEALLRWNNAAGHAVSPAEFIPVAEACGLIIPLGRWALRSACTQLAHWHKRQAMRHLSVAVNVSAKQFRQPDFVGEVMSIVRESGIDPARLKLELTESVLVEDLDDTIGKMLQLKQFGVGFALDDFGTGYSSLSYLKRLPLDQLKIDRSFVRDILCNSNDASIARSIVALAQALGLGIIAEGVETEAQRAFLAELGCESCQGYLFGKPMEASALERLAAPEEICS